MTEEEFVNHPLRFFDGFARKESDFNDVPAHAFARCEVDNLNAFSSTELGIRTGFDEFKKPVPFMFLLVHKGETYLVNTEGFDYCRYMCKVNYID